MPDDPHRGGELVAGPSTLATTYTAIFDLSRARQALLSVAQPALGAIIALGALPSVSHIVLGLIAASTGFLAVFSLNDVLDRKVDIEALAAGKAEVAGFDLDTVFSRHPLARGDISFVGAIVWVSALAATSAVCAYLLAPICLVFLGAAVALEVLYCSLRSVTWAKTFISGIMVGIGGLAGWVAVAPLSTAAISFFTFLALWEIAGRNLPNDLSDIVADGATDIRTVATVFGPKVSANATLAGAIATVGVIALLPVPAAAIVLSLAAGVWTMLLPAIDLANKPSPERAGAYFNRASLLPAIVFAVVLAVIVTGL